MKETTMPKIETPGMFRERIAENFMVGETGHLAFQEGGKERIDSMIAERDAAIRGESADAERDTLKAQVAGLEARLQGTGWISVKERLPEKETESCSVDCVICKEDGYQTLAYRYYGKLNEGNDNVWYDRVCRRNITGTVTHWMPLPESPAIVGKKEG